MAINFVPLDKEKHKDLKVAVNTSFSFAKGTHLAAASIREFAQLAATMPLVFIEDTNTQRHHVVTMLGFYVRRAFSNGKFIRCAGNNGFY